MIYTGLNKTGEVQVIHTHGGGTVEAVYGGINYQNPIFYSRKTLVGTSPLTFKGLGQPFKDYHIFGEVCGCGEWSESILDLNREYYNGFTLDTTKWMKGAATTNYAGESYLVDASITDGKIIVKSSNPGYGVSFLIPAKPNTTYSIYSKCSVTVAEGSSCIAFSSRGAAGGVRGASAARQPYALYTTAGETSYLNVVFRCAPSYGTVEYSDILICESDTIVPYGYKIPVTIGSTTSTIYIGNNPLYRVGDDSDEVSYATGKIIRRIDPDTMQPYSTPVEENPPETFTTLPTIVGVNTLTVDTTVKPSAVSITGNIKPTGYGQLLDVNDVDIQDVNNVPIFIQG